MMLRWLLAVPILFMPNMLHFEFDTGVPGLNIANLLFLLVAAGVVMSGKGKHSPDPPTGLMTAPLLFMFAVLTIGMVIAQMTMPMGFLEDFTYLKNALFYPLLYFVYRRCRQDLNGTRQLIILVMVVAAIAGVEAIREGLDYGIGNYAETRRASGPFGVDYHAANRAGVFYAMFLPMFVAMALFFRKQKWWRLAAVSGAALLAMAVMVTYSRQSYFIALMGIALLLIRRNVVLALIIAALALPAVNLLPVSVTQRVAETEQQDAVGGEQLDVSTASRFEIWGGAMQMWNAHPFGVGLNRFQQHIGDYAPRYRHYDAHSMYVLMLAECGPLGLIALLWLMWRLLRVGLLLVRSSGGAEDKDAKAVGLGFIMLVTCMAMGNLYGSPFFEGPVMANVWILCGLIEHYAALKRQAATPRNQDDAPPGTQDPRSSPPIARFPLAAKALPGRRY